MASVALSAAARSGLFIFFTVKGLNRSSGPERERAPTSSPDGPKTGAETAAHEGSRSPKEATARGTVGSMGRPDAKSRRTFPGAPRRRGSRSPSRTRSSVGWFESMRKRQRRVSSSCRTWKDGLSVPCSANHKSTGYTHSLTRFVASNALPSRMPEGPIAYRRSARRATNAPRLSEASNRKSVLLYRPVAFASSANVIGWPWSASAKSIASARSTASTPPRGSDPVCFDIAFNPDKRQPIG